jgi:WD repeat-containing protein 68
LECAYPHPPPPSEHSTIIFETPEPQHLLRLAWNKQDGHYLATCMMDSPKVCILDIRVPSHTVSEPSGHSEAVNALAWAPHSSCHLATAGDDTQALIWDLSQIPKPVEDPILAYNAEQQINNLQWSAAQSEWISIAFGDKMQILRV